MVPGARPSPSSPRPTPLDAPHPDPTHTPPAPPTGPPSSPPRVAPPRARRPADLRRRAVLAAPHWLCLHCGSHSPAFALCPLPPPPCPLLRHERYPDVVRWVLSRPARHGRDPGHRRRGRRPGSSRAPVGSRPVRRGAAPAGTRRPLALGHGPWASASGHCAPGSEGRAWSVSWGFRGESERWRQSRWVEVGGR